MHCPVFKNPINQLFGSVSFVVITSFSLASSVIYMAEKVLLSILQLCEWKLSYGEYCFIFFKFNNLKFN